MQPSSPSINPKNLPEDIQNECLNCGTTLFGTYCSGCGQRAATTRISVKHLIFQDLIQGFFNLHKGFFFTVGQILSRPGQAAREYLAGQRIPYFNLLKLLVLVTAIYILSEHALTKEDPADTELKKLLDFLDNYSRWTIFSSGFVFAAYSSLFFRKAYLNYGEHLVINGFLLAGLLIFNSLNVLIHILGPNLDMVNLIATIGYLFWGYYGAFRRHYSWGEWIWRAVLQIFISLGTLFFLLTGCISIYMKSTHKI